MRHQGRTSWRRFNEAVQAGRIPTREVLDGALVIFGGALLLTPGFITDILGFALLIPPSRAVVRAVLARRLAHRMVVSATRVRAQADYDVEGTAVDVDPDRIERRGRLPTDTAAAATFAFADPEARVYGLAWLGAEGSLLVLFDGGRPWVTRADEDVPVRSDAARERLRFDDGAGNALDLVFDAASPAAELDAAEPAARAGGVVGSEQLCHVHGTARSTARRARCAASASAGSRMGQPDWERVESTRTLDGVARRRAGRGAQRRAPGRRRRPRPRRRGRAVLGAAGGAAGSTSRGSRRPTTRRAASGAPGSSCGSARTTTSRGARPARCCAARRSTSASCGSTARSCAGGWRAAGRRPLRRAAAAHDPRRSSPTSAAC